MSTGAEPAREEAARLGELVRATPHLMQALRAARDVDAPDWLITAGAVRDAVWDALQGRPAGIPRDLDVAFFDAGDLTSQREEEIAARLRARAPNLSWDVKNQAAVHLWYPERFGVGVDAFACCADAVATFPETATCVGIRLVGDDELHVVAPYGLGDLLDGVCRHNPARVCRAFFEARVAEKNWATRWPRVRVIGS